MNFEDYVQPSGGGDNIKLGKFTRLFLDQCGARMHWGKAGWPKHLPCFNGAAAYPETWCDFGCAVHQLDPEGKFRTESKLWQWNATKDGVPVEYGSCCTPQGFDKAQCMCAPVNPCEGEVAATAGGAK